MKLLIVCFALLSGLSQPGFARRYLSTQFFGVERVLGFPSPHSILRTPLGEELMARTCVEKIVNEKDAAEVFVKQAPVYVGFDATADSLHVGHLGLLVMVRRFACAGFRTVIVVGDATAQLGDPSGRTTSSSRSLETDTIKHNTQRLHQYLTKFFNSSSSGSAAPIIVRNSEWLGGSTSLMNFMLNCAPNLSLSALLRREIVQKRLIENVHMPLNEFLYGAVQACDFVELHKRYGVQIQIGGGDQEGNILTGVTLGGRLGLPPFCGVTTPLLVTKSGRKMSKSEGSVIWLDPSKTTPFDFWQFWRNAPDNEAISWLKQYTDIPLEEIGKMEGLEGQELNTVKEILADQLTSSVHGVEVLLEVRRRLKGTSGSWMPKLVITPSTQVRFDAINYLWLVPTDEFGGSLDGNGFQKQ
eukprot:GHVN01058853.1.p1 GENE.GHVN01058853.1~~GHVN01058853.1.p1  ORF type:complete len:413 (-),score=50.88 GHVN01058853.1:188-1426(-)